MPLPALAVAAPYVVSGVGWGWRAYRLYRTAQKAKKAVSYTHLTLPTIYSV